MLTALDVALGKLAGVLAVGTVARQQWHSSAAALQLLEGLDVEAEVAVGLGDHGGVAAGDRIAGDDRLHVRIIGSTLGVDEEAHGVGGVPRGVHDLDRRGEPLDADDLAILQRLSGDAVVLVEGANRSAGELTEALGTVGVVVMTVSEEHEADGGLRAVLAAGSCADALPHGLAVQDVEVSLVLWTRIDDDRDRVTRTANYPRVRAFERCIAGVWRQHHTDVLGDRAKLTVRGMLHNSNSTKTRG